MERFSDWLEALRARRERWVNASHENNFDRGIWNATVEKYADPSHFVFELLQNAEDTGATWIRFILEHEKIVFEHDGRPFDREDIEGITGIGNTTKLNQGHKIGTFGIGFKSVYVVTERPEVHSTIEGRPLAFAIEDLVVPRLLPTDHVGATTRIVLPLRSDRAGLTVSLAREELMASGAMSLLFLENIKRLEWNDGEVRGETRVEDHADGIRSLITDQPDGAQRLDRFLVLSEPVNHHDEHKQYAVKAALRVNVAGELVAEDAPTRLRVFFETEENTGLYFTIHGPFQLTDNRANIKREDPWNAELVKAIGTLVANALPALRDRGLFKRSTLELLPNAADELPPAFAPIRSAVVAKFAEEALILAHGEGFVTIASGLRGPADLRELVGEDGLAPFANKSGRRWIAAGLRHGRAEAFLATLKIEEWGYAEFMQAFQQTFTSAYLYLKTDIDRQKDARKWFDTLPDERVQQFYLALEAATKVVKSTNSIAHLQFVRLEDGRRHSPPHAFFAPADSGVDPEAETSDLFLVKRSLVRSGRGRGKDVEQFLRRLGVKDVDERAYLAAILRTQYWGEGLRPTREKNLQHMRRFIRWWKEHHDVSLFRERTFIRAGAGADYHAADDVYLGAPYVRSALHKVYDGTIADRQRSALWAGYERINRKDLIDFLIACGVEASLTVESSSIPYRHPHYSDLHDFGSSRHTDTGIDIDYNIEGLKDILKRGDPDLSRLIWEAARRAGSDAMIARYSPNQSKAAHQAPSSLAIVLRDAVWIPAKDGSLKQPKTMTSSDLGSGFAIGGNELWLQAIGFGEEQRQRSDQHKAKLRAGELIGLSAKIVTKLSELTPEALAALNDDIIRKIENHSYSSPLFPTRESGDPVRRAERVANRAASAPVKTYEDRDRSVRVGQGETRVLARTYLEDHYTNQLGEMVCQACHQKMPFDLPQGGPYFEACELLGDLSTELAENHLALCPTCAAKWRYASGTSEEDLRRLLASAAEPEIEIRLAGQPVRLRFTQVHLDDIRTVGGWLARAR